MGEKGEKRMGDRSKKKPTKDTVPWWGRKKNPLQESVQRFMTESKEESPRKKKNFRGKRGMSLSGFQMEKLPPHF